MLIIGKGTKKCTAAAELLHEKAKTKCEGVKQVCSVKMLNFIYPPLSLDDTLNLEAGLAK